MLKNPRLTGTDLSRRPQTRTGGAHMIDAWIQHSIDRHFGDPMFNSLRRWTKSDLDAVPTIADTSLLWMPRVFQRR